MNCCQNLLAGVLGFEPRPCSFGDSHAAITLYSYNLVADTRVERILRASETPVLPLHQSAITRYVFCFLRALPIELHMRNFLT